MVGSTYNITWESTGIDKIDIGYRRDNDAEIMGWIGQDVPALQGRYSWTIPEEVLRSFNGYRDQDVFRIVIGKSPVPTGLLGLNLEAGETIHSNRDNFIIIKKDETANWQIYTSEEFGFEVKIPPNSQLKNNTDDEWRVLVYENEKNVLTYAADFRIYVLRVEGLSEENKRVQQRIEDSLLGEEIIEGPVSIIKRGDIGLDNCTAIQFFVKTDSSESYVAYCERGDSQLNFSVSFSGETPNLTKKKAKEFYDQVLSTFRFIETAQGPFQRSDEFRFFGTLKLTGYFDTQTWTCDLDDEFGLCSETVEYGSFIFSKTDQDSIYDYLEESKGNSFIGSNSVGLGCYEEENGRIISYNEADNGGVMNTITGEQLEKLLLSSESNPVELKLTKPIYTSGRGAPECYSHFRFFEVSN
ncbi:hypothetical protein IIA94_02310 [Patescibacteria group bacterium]|nr:hypothetical protein [Patescibacteria group bacterium]